MLCMHATYCINEVISVTNRTVHLIISLQSYITSCAYQYEFVYKLKHAFVLSEELFEFTFRYNLCPYIYYAAFNLRIYKASYYLYQIFTDGFCTCISTQFHLFELQFLALLTFSELCSAPSFYLLVQNVIFKNAGDDILTYRKIIRMGCLGAIRRIVFIILCIALPISLNTEPTRTQVHTFYKLQPVEQQHHACLSAYLSQSSSIKGEQQLLVQFYVRIQNRL